MTHNSLSERGRAMEEAFFAKVDQDLLQRLRERLDLEARMAALRAASGISDEKVLQGLAAANFQPESLMALSLLPLVHVAWANGHVPEEERQAVLRAAHESGVDRTAEASAMLESWLRHPPNPHFIENWKAYIAALGASLTRETFQSLKFEVLRRSREVAEAAGGYLGVAPLTGAEKAALHEIERAFETHP